jgi:hypothetical protein
MEKYFKCAYILPRISQLIKVLYNNYKLMQVVKLGLLCFFKKKNYLRDEEVERDIL